MASGFFAIKSQGFEQGSVRDREKNRIVRTGRINQSMPVPRWHIEAVALAPCRVDFRRSAFADLGDTPAAHNVVDGIAGMPMGSRLLTGTQQLKPAAHRWRGWSTVLRIAVFQNGAVEWIARPRRC